MQQLLRREGKNLYFTEGNLSSRIVLQSYEKKSAFINIFTTIIARFDHMASVSALIKSLGDASSRLFSCFTMNKSLALCLRELGLLPFLRLNFTVLPLS